MKIKNKRGQIQPTAQQPIKEIPQQPVPTQPTAQQPIKEIPQQPAPTQPPTNSQIKETPPQPEPVQDEPKKKFKWWIWLIAALVIVLILIGIFYLISSLGNNGTVTSIEKEAEAGIAAGGEVGIEEIDEDFSDEDEDFFDEDEDF